LRWHTRYHTGRNFNIKAYKKKVQAFHFKGGQGAKTGTGGHLSGNKVVGKIAKVRKLDEGTPAVTPPTFA
jgi:glutamate synthase domain-containing protein 2